MNKAIFKIKLPISHCLYRGAYSGLCCGNVYRDMKDDGSKERYDLGDKTFPVIHGHTYEITLTVLTEEPLMKTDYVSVESIFNKYFDEYKNAMILTPDNPIVSLYEKNASKLFIWPENPTAEYMARYWYEVFKAWFIVFREERNFQGDLTIEVEETSHNSVTYSEKGYTISTFIELPIAKELDSSKEKYKTLTGFNYFLTIKLTTNSLDENGMVIDFKKMKKILHSYLDQYDHSLILYKESPLVDAYKSNLKTNDISFERSRVFVWDKPTNDFNIVEKMGTDLGDLFIKDGLKIDNLTAVIENGLGDSFEITKKY